MSDPCCTKAPQLCQKQLCKFRVFSKSLGSELQGSGSTHSRGVNLKIVSRCQPSIKSKKQSLVDTTSCYNMLRIYCIMLGVAFDASMFRCQKWSCCGKQTLLLVLSLKWPVSLTFSPLVVVLSLLWFWMSWTCWFLTVNIRGKIWGAVEKRSEVMQS